MSEPFQVLLYYKYSTISDPAEYAAQHRALCERLDLKGRILIAHEGINGTVSGTSASTTAYQEALDNDPITKGIEWKIDPATDHVFPKLSIKVRDEIVTLGLGQNDFSPEETTGDHLSPESWQEMMKQDDVVLIDARNDYEWELGHFEKALLPKVDSFRELPQWIRDHREDLEGKKIMTYCTGGIRCEKFSGFLVKEGFQDVFQLDGGIVTYGKDKKTKGEGFLGECYVFDERVSVPVNHSEGAQTIARCTYCGDPAHYHNCSWQPCNEQFFICDHCQEKEEGYCSPICREAAVMSSSALEEA